MTAPQDPHKPEPAPLHDAALGEGDGLQPRLEARRGPRRSAERPLFLDQLGYRRRLAGDAARILPFIALLAVLAPVALFPEGGSYARLTATLFAVWALIVVAIAWLHHVIARADAALEAAPPRENTQ